MELLELRNDRELNRSFEFDRSMELPRPRPVGGEGGGGRRKAMHDFLSLCTHSSSSSSTLHQDPPTRLPPPPSTSPRENSLKTHDFLGRTTGEEQAASCVASSAERPQLAAQSLQTLPIPYSVEHSLPGGIGTYSISHVSYFTNKLPVPKPETTGMRPFTLVRASRADRTDGNSNCSSYANSGFTLWEESAGKKGKTRKENVHSAATAVRESEVRLGRWSTSDKPAQLSSNGHHHRSSFSSFSSSQPPGQTNKGFVDMMKSAKGSSSQDDEFKGEETEFMVKKESSPVPIAELRVKIDGKSSEQKANTPRSKHSATEQRRRSKINDRFQMLRALIPRSEQKRDRASFLSEVIEHIQMLQEKVTKCEEGSYQGWIHEPAKVMMPLRNGQKPGDSFIDQSRSATNGSNTTMIFSTKVDEDNDSMMSGTPPETNVSSATTFKAASPYPHGIGNNAFPFPISLHPNLSAGPRDVSKPRTVECAAALYNKLKEEELAVEGGSKSFSNAYSHGLLNILKQVLQSSGVDLSQASISVQIELGKRGNPSAVTTSPFPKDIDAVSKVRCVTRTRVGTEDSEQALKKPKTCKAQV